MGLFSSGVPGEDDAQPYPQSMYKCITLCYLVDNTRFCLAPSLLLHRLKMGVSEGVPASIMPDHMGRADYHGASINQAARIMDAGDHFVWLLHSHTHNLTPEGRGGALAATYDLIAITRACWDR